MDEGRIARGLRLSRESWSVVRLRPALLVIAAVSLLVQIAGSLLLLGPWAMDIVGHHSRERLFVDAAIGAYPFTFAVTYFNVAFYTLAAATIDGRPMTTAQAFDRARSRLWAVAAWAFVATVVAVLLRSLEQLPGGGFAGRLVEWVGNIAWALASFFVVPVLALENVGVGAALRRSASTIRRTWGESVTGAAVIGFGSGFVVLAFVGVGALGVASGQAGYAAAYGLTALAAVAVAALIVFQSALILVFRLAVYRYASGEGGTGPFATADLEGAFKPRRRRFGSRS
jgi:Family of unknown function (DUF6159)